MASTMFERTFERNGKLWLSVADGNLVYFLCFSRVKEELNMKVDISQTVAILSLPAMLAWRAGHVLLDGGHRMVGHDRRRHHLRGANRDTSHLHCHVGGESCARSLNRIR